MRCWPFVRSQIHGALVVVGTRADFSSGGDQDLGQFEIAVLGGGMKRGPTSVLAGIDRGSVLDQELDDSCVPARGGGV